MLTSTWAPREADPRPVEALDHGLLGRPPAGQPLVVARAVGELGGGVDLVQEPGSGALDGKRDPIHRNCVHTDALHGCHSAATPHPAASRPTSPASGEVKRPP